MAALNQNGNNNNNNVVVNVNTPTLRRSKKPLQSVWNNTERKLIIFIIEASGLVLKKNESIEAYVKVLCGKSSKQTKIAPKTPDPYWGEFLFFTPSATESNSSLTFSVYARKLIDKCLGQFTIKLSDYDKEKVVDLWCELKPRSEKKRSLTTRNPGKVHLRMYFSLMKESSPDVKLNQFHNFFYDQYLPRFKTGDLVVFGGVGLLPTLIKCFNNSEYSSLGIIVGLPNKYTDKEELYVFEITRNIDELFDHYADLPKLGACLFRLDERIHQFHGNGVWWAPLVSPLSSTDKEALIKKIRSLWSSFNPFEGYKKSYVEINNYLQSQFHVGKYCWDVCEVFAPNIITSILKEANVPLNIGETGVTVSVLVEQEVFAHPIPLRTQKLLIPFDHAPTEKTWQLPTSYSLNYSANNNNYPFSTVPSSPYLYAPIVPNSGGNSDEDTPKEQMYHYHFSTPVLAPAIPTIHPNVQEEVAARTHTSATIPTQAHTSEPAMFYPSRELERNSEIINGDYTSTVVIPPSSYPTPHNSIVPEMQALPVHRGPLPPLPEKPAALRKSDENENYVR